MKPCRPPFSPPCRATAAFTMIEIALCLAIIGVGLVAIVGVLPIGLNTQRDTREETVVNQDATVLLEAIRNGQHGADDLTNYVYAITNYWTLYNANGNVAGSGIDGYNYQGSQVTKIAPPPSIPLTNGANIIGLLSTPEFTTNASGFYLPIPTLFNNNGYSNHVVAYVRSLSGLATEKPPQNNDLMVGDSFSYRIYCVNAGVPFDTNRPFAGYVRQLFANEHELRMTFLWPQQPNGSLGSGRHTYRTTIAGQLGTNAANQGLYFYQPQTFKPQP